MGFRRDEEFENIKVSLPKIYATRQRVTASLSKFIGRVLDHASFVEAGITLSLCFPKKCVPTPVVEGLLSQYLRKPLTAKDIEKIAAQVAGRANEVLRGVVLTAYDYKLVSEWGAIKMICAEKSSRMGKGGMVQHGAKMQLEVISGACSSLKYYKFWSSDALNYARYRLGFDEGDDSKYPYMGEASFTSLYFLGLFDGPNMLDTPDYSDLACTDYLRSKNRALLRKRYRHIHQVNKFQCPRNYGDEIRCTRCPAGLTECQAATHTNAYIESKCQSCYKVAWTDPVRPSACIDCRTLLSLKTVKD